MLITLAWKEFCEHRSIWLTMVVMTSVSCLGLAQIVAAGDPTAAIITVALALFCMAGAYGVVCGAMMFAGEHEGGTLVFLDIFLGRRGLLWLGKAALGVPFALSEGLAVALIMVYFGQEPPTWAQALVGLGREPGLQLPELARDLGNRIWLLVLPLITLEAYVWGLFGSVLTRRVLSGAAVAAGTATLIWLPCVNAPSLVFLLIRAVVGCVLLAVSCVVFVRQAREAALGPPPRPDERGDDGPRLRLDAVWDELQNEHEYAKERTNHEPAALSAVLEPVAVATTGLGRVPERGAGRRRRRQAHPAGAPVEALLWLTCQQAWALVGVLALVCLAAGLFVPLAGQVLWPIATLLVGVACGTATFAPEQRELSYQFLAAAHLPMRAIWRFRIVFWLVIALVLTALLALGALTLVFGRAVAGPGAPPLAVPLGTLRELLGPVLFFSMWLVYGFCTGQVVVWLCRKSVLAVLLSALVSAGALGLWLPSLLSRGMSGWQVWLAPVVLLVAGHALVRAWAGGRIKERRPTLALGGVVALVVGWAVVNFGYRAWEIPDVGMPVDRVAYRASLPTGERNATLKIQSALANFEEEQKKWGRPPRVMWRADLADAVNLPPGVIELPRSDGQAPTLQHLPVCRSLTETLCGEARTAEPAAALASLTQVLALSRTLRNKAPLAGYVFGVTTELQALDGLDLWRARPKPVPPALLRQALDTLSRHAAETPGADDCVRGECFRAAGLLENPTLWAFSAHRPDEVGTVPEKWLSRSIVLSLELSWEAERRTRLWQLVWAGLIRGVETPFWEAPREAMRPVPAHDTTARILRGWLPAERGPRQADVAALLQESWLTDERLFAPVVPLRDAALQARCRVAATRLALALALYQRETGQPAAQLSDLVPKYLPSLPVDPYRGAPFQYRVSAGEVIDGLGPVRAGQGVVWSTGPDQRDHGGQHHAAHLKPDDPAWDAGAFDLITLVP